MSSNISSWIWNIVPTMEWKMAFSVKSDAGGNLLTKKETKARNKRTKKKRKRKITKDNEKKH